MRTNFDSATRTCTSASKARERCGRGRRDRSSGGHGAGLDTTSLRLVSDRHAGAPIHVRVLDSQCHVQRVEWYTCTTIQPPIYTWPCTCLADAAPSAKSHNTSMISACIMRTSRLSCVSVLLINVLAWLARNSVSDLIALISPISYWRSLMRFLAPVLFIALC